MADMESPLAAANKTRIRKLQCFQHTDAGNAEAFELLHGDDFKFHFNKGKWLAWNDRHHAEDEDGKIQRAALNTARELLSAAALIKHIEDRKRGIQWALRSESVYGRKSMLISAQSIKSLATTTKDYDRDPFLLTVGNGTLDLRTARLHDASRKDLITRATDVSYDPSATAPRWIQFLHEIFGDQKEVIDYVQRAV